MSLRLLRGRPEERFKLSIGLLAGTAVALPANVLALSSRQPSPEFAYVVVAVVVVGILLRRRSFVVGVSGSVLVVSLPAAVVALLPTPVTAWHVSAGVLWLIALTILGCLYLMREAETRTNADIDPGWLFRPQE